MDREDFLLLLLAVVAGSWTFYQLYMWFGFMIFLYAVVVAVAVLLLWVVYKSDKK